jgi:hypothetical protein
MSEPINKQRTGSAYALRPSPVPASPDAWTGDSILRMEKMKQAAHSSSRIRRDLRRAIGLLNPLGGLNLNFAVNALKFAAPFQHGLHLTPILHHTVSIARKNIVLSLWQMRQ